MKTFLKHSGICLALAVAVCLSSCASDSKDMGSKTAGTGSAAAASTDVVFPLETPASVEFMVSGTQTTTFADSIKNNKLWQKFKTDTNVDITFRFLGDTASEKLALLVNSGSYGDVLWGGPVLNSVEASKYIAAGVFTDLTPFINEKVTPNLAGVLADKPMAKKMITATDGKIYTIPKITDVDGQFLESPIWINKKWLDKLGLPIPKTLDELTAALRAFGTQDPNGNGTDDEIAYLASTSHSFLNLEAMMGMWGLATKSGTNDSFVQVKNGKVLFVPITDAYKESLKWYRLLYKEGLLWPECFTANSSTTAMKLTSTVPVVGCFTNNSLPSTDYSGDYVCIAPPKVTGYETCWYYHPAINGSNNQFFITDKCKNLAVVMKWADQLFTLDNAIAFEEGLPGEGRIEMDAEGKYTYKTLTNAETSKLSLEAPTLYSLMGNSARALTAKDYASRLPLSKSETVMQSCFNIYKNAVTTEIWPRPYLTPEDANKAYSTTTDIFYQVSTQRAKWVTGQGDIDKDWDAYLKKINSLGLEEFIAIFQKSYDTFISAGS
jgi:putative aldouronate transport system substrate-binding protein